MHLCSKRKKYIAAISTVYGRHNWYTVKVQMTSTKAVCLRFQVPLTSGIVHQQEIFVHHSLTAQWTSEAPNM